MVERFFQPVLVGTRPLDTETVKAMDRYYKTNIRALPIGLVWSWGKPRSFWVFLVRKVLAIPVYGPTLVPEQPAVIEVQEVAAEADLGDPMALHRAQLEALGFRAVPLYKMPTLGPSRSLGRALVSADAKALCLLVSTGTGDIVRVATAITSIAPDGRMIGTSSAVLRLPPVPGIDIVRRPGASADAVARHHASRLSAFPAKHLEPADVVPFILQQQQRALEYYVAQGIYVPASGQDIERARPG